MAGWGRRSSRFFKSLLQNTIFYSSFRRWGRKHGPSLVRFDFSSSTHLPYSSLVPTSQCKSDIRIITLLVFDLYIHQTYIAVICLSSWFANASNIPAFLSPPIGIIPRSVVVSVCNCRSSTCTYQFVVLQNTKDWYLHCFKFTGNL
jgi:hypothetical protein